MTNKITRDEAIKIYDDTTRRKLDEALDTTLTICENIDRIAHITGAQQAAALGNAIANADDPRLVIMIDSGVYVLNIRHMDIVDPIFDALNIIVDLGKAEILNMREE